MENKHLAIAAELRRRIRDGEYGDRLPVSAELAAEFGVNIKTIHKALAHLTAEGLIERRRRDGTRVRAGMRAERHLVEVLFEGFATIFSHPFWSEIWNGMTEVLLAEGFLPVLHMLRTSPDSGVLQLEDFEMIPSAGKIILGIGEKRLLDRVAATGVPFIAGCDRINDPRVAQIVFDFRRGMADAVKFLHENGAKKIAFIGQCSNYISLGYLHKFESYLSAIQHYSAIDPGLISEAAPLPGSGAAAVEHLLRSGTVPDAAIAAYDHQLPEILTAFRQHGMEIPLIGCDGLELPELEPHRPAVVAPRRKCGELLAHELVASIRQHRMPGSRTLDAIFFHGRDLSAI